MEVNAGILVALLTGHVFGEVIWDRSGLRRWEQVLISAGVPVVAYLVLGVWSFWPVVVVSITMWLVTRPFGSVESSSRTWLVVNGLVVLIFVIAAWGMPASGMKWLEGGRSVWSVEILQLIAGATGLTVTVWMGSGFMNRAIRPFAVQMRGSAVIEDGGQVIEPLENGFRDGGRVIGIYERLLIFLFVLVDIPTAIGFLVTAKSILRFGDLRDTKNRKNAEYIIIGTLISFAYALVTSYATLSLMSLVGS